MKSKFLRVLSFFIFPVIVFTLGFILNSVFNLIEIFPWNDIPLHFVGGLAVGYMFVLFLRFFEEEKMIEIKSRFVFVVVVVALTGLTAILWEFYEYLMVYFFNFLWNMTYEDTLLDLLIGLCGGFVAGIFGKV